MSLTMLLKVLMITRY